MRRALIVVAVLAAAGLVVWALGRPERTESLAFRDVTKAYPDLQYERSTVLTFRNRADLERHLRERSAFKPPRLPPIDFGNEMLIVVAAGARSTSGYHLEPLQVLLRGGVIEVRVREISPGPDRVVAPVLTYPYLALAVPRHSERVRLRLAG